MTVEYMSFTEVADQLGVKTGALATYKLPEPDAIIGRTRGWLPDTPSNAERGAMFNRVFR